MLDLANTLMARAARMIFAGPGEPALWTVSVHGRVIGSLVSEAGQWRLAWFDPAEPLAAYRGPVGGDTEALAAALSARRGAPVRLESLAA
jgi:hypothetical protein